MGDEPSVRPLWRRWQSLLAILMFVLNVDYVIMPTLQAVWRIGGWALFWSAAIAASIEVCVFNWYSKWLVLNAVRSVKRSERLQRAAGAFVHRGLLGQLKDFGEDFWDWFVAHSLSHTRPDGETKERMLKGAVSIISSSHVVMMYPMMLGLGLLPWGWAFGIGIQRLRPVPGAFGVLLAANAVKTYFIGLLYLWLPWWAKLLVMAVIVTALVLAIRKVARKVREFQSASEPTAQGPSV